jgi:hypothetical protein
MKAYHLHWIALLISLLMLKPTVSQNVGINATGAIPSAWAMLDIAHSTKGLLIPRVSLSALNNASPIGAGMPVSMLVYNTASAGTSPNNVVPGYYYWDGSGWVAMAGDGGKNWSLKGNTGTVDGTNFIGTLDNIPFSIRVNNQPAGRVDHLVRNTFLGYTAGNANAGTGNTALGHMALSTNTTGSGNTATGTYAMRTNGSGQLNTANGYSSLFSNLSGSYNTGIGNNALYSNVSGDYNTGVGNNALTTNTAGIGNTALGAEAMNQNRTGNYNSSSGYQSMQYNTTGSYNAGVGSFALNRNTIGESNVAVGPSSMLSNNDGDENTAAGRFSLYGNVSGNANTAAGFAALQNSTSSNNTAIGHKALFSVNSGGVNTAIGASASYNNTNGFRNVALGYTALYLNTTGSDNTAVGSFALQGVLTGSNNIGIGVSAAVPNPNASNQVRIGNTAITYAGIQVAWSVTSDKRWKSKITASNLGLNFIKALRPVSYVRTNDEGKKVEYGFIAQEVETQLNISGAANSGIITKDEEGMLSMRYNDLIAPMVKAIQQQQDMIDELKLRNKVLEERLTALEEK